MDEVEIQAFEADTKASKGLTAAHVAEIASGYDPEKNPAPLVWGHPASDSPSLGVIAAARAEGAKLFVKVKNIAKEVIDGVKEGRILNRSVAIWAPDHPSNPNPGKYSLRHLGLLGGQAPAIPNMPRLRFASDDSVLESDEGPADALLFTVEPSPTKVQEVREPSPAKEPTMTEDEIKAKEAEFDARQKELDEREAAAKKREEEFAASETKRRESENEAAIAAAIEAGKVLPAEKEGLAAIFNALPVKAMTFSAELGGECEPRQALAKFLDALPKRTAVGEGRKSPEGEFSADGAKEKADKALEEANKRQAQAYRQPEPANA